MAGCHSGVLPTLPSSAALTKNDTSKSRSQADSAEPSQACEAQREKEGFEIHLPPADPRLLQCFVEHQAGDPSAPSPSRPTCFRWSCRGAFVLYAALTDRSTAQRPCALRALFTDTTAADSSLLCCEKCKGGGGNRRDVKSVTAST